MKVIKRLSQKNSEFGCFWAPLVKIELSSNLGIGLSEFESIRQITQERNLKPVFSQPFCARLKKYFVGNYPFERL